jgi:opacity protein-like surface antigen
MLKSKFAAVAAVVLLSSSALASEGSYNHSHKGGDSSSLFAGLGFNGFYGKVSGAFGNRDSSLSGVKVKAKSSASFALGLGAHLTEDFRTEVVMNYHVSEKDKSNTYKSSAFAPMLNFAYDVNLSTFVKPYVMAGLGLSLNHVKFAAANSTQTLKNKTSFAYNFGAGLGVEVAKGVDLDLGYLYSNLGKPASLKTVATGATTTFKALKSSAVQASLRFKL